MTIGFKVNNNVVSSSQRGSTRLLVNACGLVFTGLVVGIAQPVFQRENALNAVVPFVVVVVLFGLGLMLSPSIGRTRLAPCLMALFLIRLGIAVVYHQMHWPNGEELFTAGLTGYDAFRYDRSAAEVVLYGWQNALISVDEWGIVYFYQIVYQIFGHNPLFVVLFNSLLGGMISILIFHWARSFTSLRVARWGALTTMIIPDSVLYGGLLMKEMLVMFIFYVSLLAWARFRIHRWIPGLLIFIATLYGMMETRGAFLLVLVAIAGSILLIEWRQTLQRPITLLIIVLSVVFLATLGVSNYSRGFNMLDPNMWIQRASDLSAYAIPQIVNENSAAASSIGLNTKVNLSSPITWVFVPFRMAVFYLNPPFWRWGIFEKFVPFNELTAIMSWACMPAMMWGLWRMFRQSRGYYLWIPFLLASLIISLAPFVDPRYKISLLPLFFLFACIGFEEFRKWRQLYPLYVLAIIGIMIGYYVIKGALG